MLEFKKIEDDGNAATFEYYPEGGSVEKVGVVPDPKRVGPASQNLEYG